MNYGRQESNVYEYLLIVFASIQLVTRDHVRTIVTLSNDHSDNLYWPAKGTQQYGKFQVRINCLHSIQNVILHISLLKNYLIKFY